MTAGDDKTQSACESASAMMTEELAIGISLYLRKSGCKSLTTQRTRKPPKTHMHAEMIERRRNPQRSVKSGVEDALHALAQGDIAAVEALMARSGDTPVGDDWQKRYKDGAQDYWDHFYKEKTVNFFKDRHYLREEFGELMPEEVLADPRRWVAPLECDEEPPSSPSSLQRAMQDRSVLLELGCAVGNGVMPLLRANPNLFAIACDLSPVAVSLLQAKEEYRCGRCLAFPCDIARGEGEQPTELHRPLEAMVPADVVDFATLLFVLSAINPSCHQQVLRRICGRLRPGGMVLLRDYGRGDLAQLRFSPSNWLGGDLYVRGDGTLAYFFTVEGLIADFEAAGFETVECEYRRTEIVNREKDLRMPRVWVQGRFRKRA